MFRSLLFIASFFSTCFAAAAFASQTPNPAATYCVEQGGTYSIVEEAEGQRGICTLTDGRSVDAWEYFRQQHAAALQTSEPVLADRIWSGGPILTMVDGAMRAEALAEKNGIILAVGSAEQIMAMRGSDAETPPGSVQSIRIWAALVCHE